MLLSHLARSSIVAACLVATLSVAWSDEIPIAGSCFVKPMNTVTVRSRFATKIVGIHKQNGAAVAKGDPLFTTEHEEICAPISGRLQLIIPRVDDLAVAGSNLATIVQMSPARVEVDIPSDRIEQVRESLNSGKARVHVTPVGVSRTLEGRLSIIDDQPDEVRDSRRGLAVMPNDEEVLWPGMVCHARLLVE